MSDTVTDTGIPEKILDKVRALLVKAESTTFEHEAEAFAAKAAELVARYGLEQTLRRSPERDDDPMDSKVIILSEPYALTKADLLHQLAKRMSCHVIRRSAQPAYPAQPAITLPDGRVLREATPAVEAQPARATVYGHRSDLERVEFLYTSLLVQAHRMVRAVRPDRPGANVRAYRRAWLIGFACRIGERLDALVKTVVEESETPGAALVLVDRAALANAAMRKAHPNMRTTTTTISSRSGFNAGRAAANRADLGQARVGSRRAAIGAGR